MTPDDKTWLVQARALYARSAQRSMAWMLARPRLHGVFLNTKMSSITLQDYTGADGWRGPDILYGWIQGRGLEALVRHADFFATEAPDLAAEMLDAARLLYPALADLYGRHGRGFFYYDRDLNPVRPGDNEVAEPQAATGDLHSYADIFVLKGLLTAATRFDPPACETYLAGLDRVVQSVEQGRFVSDEKQSFGDLKALQYAPDFGPRMIMLGAAALLRYLGFSDAARFDDRFIEHVLRNHVEDGGGALPRGAVRDVPGQDHCNPGHAIEFAGFALECLPAGADRDLVESLEHVLLTCFRLGFTPPGIDVRISLSGTEAPMGHYPWWALPETIRAAAAAFRRTGNPASLATWRRAHDAFFDGFWRDEPPVAYHTLSPTGPLDYVPATPDLDPGYHTGLSLLGAIGSADQLLSDTA